MAGLYLHIPFCAKKCAYCDFASYAGREDAWQPVIEKMKEEMRAARGMRFGTVFFGGGTPTLLPAEMLTELLDEARDCFDIDKDAEITVEGNPGTFDKDKLTKLRQAGVNRLSIGAQASQDALLKTLGRIHRWADVESAVYAAREADFTNLNLDLMYGLPDQTPAMFRETLTRALALSPEHLSMYSLILEEGTPICALSDKLPAEDALSEMADDALWMAEDAGLVHYEISNYAKPGFESRHNLGYWLREEYLGIGCAAHSLVRNARWGNARTLEGYLRGEREESLMVSEEEARFERLMLGLRLIEGIEWGERALFEQYEMKMKSLRLRGLLEYDDTRVWLTRRGLDLQNRVLVELMG